MVSLHGDCSSVEERLDFGACFALKVVANFYTFIGFAILLLRWSICSLNIGGVRKNGHFLESYYSW